jgi:uncharacterized protein (DUF2235 family)
MEAQEWCRRFRPLLTYHSVNLQRTRFFYAKAHYLLADGTWNDAETGDADTNIVSLHERIARYLKALPSQQATKRLETSPSSARQRTVVLKQPDNLVFYERGVGTSGFFDWLKGGALGAGLSEIVRRTYTFLAQN